MKISLEWLNDYVDVKDFLQKPEVLAKALTTVGLEVEGILDRGKPYQQVKLGQVVKLDRHPNADKLTLCQVDVGDGTLRQIVCGAKNHKQGDKVVVALPGAVLPSDKVGPDGVAGFAIKLSKIRDVESQGMLCSEVELGIAKESDGIMILPADVTVGQSFAEYYGMSDVVLEVNVTPNRSDCLSHLGIAREVACIFDRPLKVPATTIGKTSGSIKKSVTVELLAAELCPRYAGRIVSGVKVGPSPRWLVSRLEAAGVSSINNIVDIGNYVMLELGQPLHMFDLDLVAGQTIRVENSKCEKFESFDGTTYELTGEELTIRDGQKAMVVAGIIGSKNSGVSNTTSRIFIEAAHFNPATIRRTSRRFGVDTDSSFRFARGTDPEGVLTALNRACHLVQSLATGVPSDDFVDLYPQPRVVRPIKVRRRILEERLGYEVDLLDFSKWLKRLNCSLSIKADDGFGDHAEVVVPSFRWDLEGEMDLVEEYGRLNGYDKVPETFPPLMSAPTADAVSFTNENRLADNIVAQGFSEAVNYAFVNPHWQNSLIERAAFKGLGLDLGGEVVPVMNPLSEETGVMRQSLLPGLLTNVFNNCHRGNLHGRLFEIGAVFGKNPEGETKYNESSRLALSAWGQPDTLWEKTERLPVYDVKSAIESVLRALRATGYQWRSIESAQVPSFVHPGQVMVLFYQGKNVGFVGSLHPSLREQHKLRVPVALAELDVNLLMTGQPRTAKYKPISKFPAVERDLALLVPATLRAQDILKAIDKAGGSLLQTVHIFDVYTGPGTPEGFSSLAFRLKFQDNEKTLSEEAIVTAVSAILVTLEKEHQVKAR